MIIVGADTHKDTHTVVAVAEATGRQLGEQTQPARRAGFEAHLRWARGLGEGELVWALEDCRHVSSGLERFLLTSGQRVVRVAPKLMGESRKAARERGKSDAIDAANIARAALREGAERLPEAHTDQQALEIKLLADHREDLTKARSKDQQRLRGHLHELLPELEVPARSLSEPGQLAPIARKLGRLPQGARVRVAKELVKQIRASVKKTTELELELAVLVEAKAPALLEIPGCGTITAAKILAATYGVKELASDAKLARLAGVAPIPASSGKTQRHRLDRGGNRELNRALHTIALYQEAREEGGRAFIAKKKAEGKTVREARRCLKRHLARRVHRALMADRRKEA